MSHELENFINKLNQIEQSNIGNDDISSINENDLELQLLYANELNEFFLNDNDCWIFLKALYCKKIKVIKVLLQDKSPS